MPPSGNPDLLDHLSSEIEAASDKTLPFSEFMRIALYDPDFGYYAAGSTQRVGRAGDFYTSVSVGRCFGKLLAAHFLKQRSGLRQIVEQGANDGQLAFDLLEELPAGIDYVIIEPFAAVREQQRKKLGDRARWVERIGDIDGGVRGNFICNELLDAFPVRRVRFEAGEWKEIHLDAEFQEIAKPITDDELREEVEGVLGGRDLPDRYTTELHLAANAWTHELLQYLQPGARATLIDYGHEADDYYSPERTDGTLRGFRDHKQTTDFYEAIGETDLTASVNFTRIAEISGATKFVDQHKFLIEAAKPWLAEIEAKGTAPDEGIQKLLRQFNTLIHPGMLGRTFKVLEIVMD